MMLYLSVAAIIVLGSCSGLTEGQENFQQQFIDKCKRFPENGLDCDEIWKTFKSAYVGKNPCEVPPDAYNDLFTAVPFKLACNDKMMFWSKTKEIAHEISKKSTCVTLEDTLLGSILDGVKWCGKQGSHETFTDSECPTCPGEWGNTSVGAFWNRASAGFADAACGDVTVLLNGSIETPFDPNRKKCTVPEYLKNKLDAGLGDKSTCMKMREDRLPPTCIPKAGTPMHHGGTTMVVSTMIVYWLFSHV